MFASGCTGSLDTWAMVLELTMQTSIQEVILKGGRPTYICQYLRHDPYAEDYIPPDVEHPMAFAINFMQAFCVALNVLKRYVVYKNLRTCVDDCLVKGSCMLLCCRVCDQLTRAARR